MSTVTRGGALRAAWRRIHEAESLQPRWTAAAAALRESLDADLDPALLMLFMNRTRRIAHDVSHSEPGFAARWSGHLPHLIASTIAAEVLNARSPMDPPARVAALFEQLVWNLVDDDEDLEE